METKIRKHHYTFAHMVLNKYAFKDPESLYGIIDSDDGNDFLKKLWAETGELISKEDNVLPDSGLNLEINKINDDLDAAIIRMPEAVNATEAGFIALVPYKDQGIRKFKYYVLEYINKNIASICEWTQDDKYLKIIETTENNLETFVSKLNDIIIIE